MKHVRKITVKPAVSDLWLGIVDTLQSVYLTIYNLTPFGKKYPVV